MRTFAQKQNKPQQQPSRNITSPNTAAPATSHQVQNTLYYQLAIGNQAVQRLLGQAEPEDPEARSSNKVATRSDHDFSQMPATAKSPPNVQAKLTVGPPGDIYEQEADRVSEQVMRTPEPRLQRDCACGGGCPNCNAKQSGQEHEHLQTKHISSSDSGQTATPPIVHEVLASQGQPLDASTRSFMNARFGHDFSPVRVHADAKAAESAQAVNALAYTVGRDVVFGVGQYTPGSEIGRRLLAHELVHTMQQTSGPVLVQRAPGPTAGGCAAEGATVDEQRDEASWAGHLAHLQIQSFFLTSLRSEADIPRASKENRSPICPRSGTPAGYVDLWQYNGMGVVQIGEIKPITGAQYAAPEVAHYKNRFGQLVSRMTGGNVCGDAADQADVEFDEEWLGGDLVNDRRVPIARPLDTIVPMTPTVIGGFWADYYKELSCELRPGGAVVYWCNKIKKRDDKAIEKAWDAVMLGTQLSSLSEGSEKKEGPEPEKKEDRQPNKKEDRQPDNKKDPRPGRKEAPQPTASSTSTASKVARFAAGAHLLGRIAKAHIDVYGAFVSWAYTGVYEGTRGYNLNERLSELAEQGEPLAYEAGAALALASDLALMDDSADSEPETAGVRAELTRHVLKLGTQIYRAGRALEFARSYSAVEKRIDLSQGDQYALYGERSYDLRTGLGISLAETSDNDAFSLSIMIEYDAVVAEWLLTQIESILNDRMGVIKDDQRAWLEFRP
jgi:Domain of unknown function (DUF4157)